MKRKFYDSLHQYFALLYFSNNNCIWHLLYFLLLLIFEFFVKKFQIDADVDCFKVVFLSFDAKWCIKLSYKFWTRYYIISNINHSNRTVSNRQSYRRLPQSHYKIEWRYCIFDFETSTIFHDFTFNMLTISVYNLSNFVNMMFIFEKFYEASMFLI